MNNPVTINPPAVTKTSKISVPIPSSPAKGDAAIGFTRVAVGDGVSAVGLFSVGDGARVAVGSRVDVAGGGTGVSVAGGVTCSSSFCPGMMIELELNPFHNISSLILTPY